MAFQAIDIARSALNASQKAMEVVGHNVANVNTPGYSRQEIVLTAASPYPPAGSQLSPSGGQFGNGVDVLTIRRMQDTFLQLQIRMAEGNAGKAQMTQDTLQQIESVLAPGQDLDLSSMLDRFFGAWQQLAVHPEELGSRMLVRSDGVNLVNGLNAASKQLDFMEYQVATNLQIRVDRVNLLADQLAALNAQIGMARAEGRSPNDLLDQRDTVLDELTTVAGVSTLSSDESSAITSIGGRALVQGSLAFHLEFVDVGSGRQIVWAQDGTSANITSGEISGLLDVRDTVIPDYRGQLDDMASALASTVNALHVTGVDMEDNSAGVFFTGDTAGSIAIDDMIMSDPSRIAATRATGAVGDGSLARDIYAMYTTPLIGSQTLSQGAQSLTGQIGNAVRSAQTNVAIGNSMRALLYNQRQSAAGVSLDEEMANLLIYQRSYDAAARVLRTADELMQTLIERTAV